MKEKLTPEEQKTLLRMAREAMEHAVRGEKLPPLDPSELSANLREEGASFVTLTSAVNCAGASARSKPSSRSPTMCASTLSPPRWRIRVFLG